MGPVSVWLLALAMIVQIDPRVDGNAAELEGRLRTEVDAASVTAITLSARDAEKVHVRLERGTEVILRDVDLSDVPAPNRARVLALAVGEAARTPRAEAPVAAEPVAAEPVAAEPAAPALVAASTPIAVAPVAPGAADRVVAEAPSGRARWRWEPEVGFGMRTFAPASTLAWEPRVGVVAGSSSSWMRVGLAAFYGSASTSDAVGSVRLQSLGASGLVAGELALSSRLTLRVGPRVDVGAVFGTAESSTARAHGSSALYTALLGDASLRFAASDALGLALGADAGGVVSGLELRADDRRVAAEKGFTAAARVAASWR